MFWYTTLSKYKDPKLMIMPTQYWVSKNYKKNSFGVVYPYSTRTQIRNPFKGRVERLLKFVRLSFQFTSWIFLCWKNHCKNFFLLAPLVLELRPSVVLNYLVLGQVWTLKIWAGLCCVKSIRRTTLFTWLATEAVTPHNG